MTGWAFIYVFEVVLAVAFLAWVVRSRGHERRELAVLVILCTCIGINLLGNFVVYGPGWDAVVLAVYNGVLMMVDNVTSSFVNVGAQGEPVGVLTAAVYLAGVCALAATAAMVVSIASRWMNRRRITWHRFDDIVLISFASSREDAAENFVRGIADAGSGERRDELVAVKGWNAEQVQDYVGIAGTLVTTQYAVAEERAKQQGEYVEVSFLDDAVRVTRHNGKADEKGADRDSCFYRYSELVARDLVRGSIVPALISAVRADPERLDRTGVRVLVVGGLDDIVRDVVRHLVMNLQVPSGAKPTIDVWGRHIDRELGGFEHHYPGLSLVADVCCHQGDPCGTAIYAALEGKRYDYVVVVSGDGAKNMSIARELRQFFYSQGTSPSRILAYSRQPKPDLCRRFGIGTFGADGNLLSRAVLLDDAFDALAKSVNAFYAGVPNEETKTQGPKAVRRAIDDAWWGGTTQFDRDSSRAMAEFAPVEVAWERSPLGGEKDAVARLEHNRWMAFHAAYGFTPMSPETLARRYNKAKEGKARMADGSPVKEGKCAKYARADSPIYADTHLEHISMVGWDDLPKIEEAYLNVTGENGHFQNNDRDIVQILGRQDVVDRYREILGVIDADQDRVDAPVCAVPHGGDA